MDHDVGHFRGITNDHSISHQEILKYYKWGKGNLEQALNYYYRRKEKQQKGSEGQKISSKAVVKGNVFVQMGRAMMKQKKTEEFISTVREEYKLPIRGRKQTTSKEQVKWEQVNKEESVNQFEDADYLPSVLGMQMDDEHGKQDYSSFRGQDHSNKEKEQSYFYSQSKVQIQFMDIEAPSYQYQRQKKPQLQSHPTYPVQKHHLFNTSHHIYLQQEKHHSQNKDRKENNDRKDNKDRKDQIDQIDQIDDKGQTRNNRVYREDEPNVFDYVMNEPELLLGEVILTGFAIKFQNHFVVAQGEPLQFRYFIQEEKKKKSFKSVKQAQKNMNIRLVYGLSEFGRLKDEQVRIFLPLIVHNMIRLQMFAHTIPKRLDYYTNLQVKVKVFLLKRAITQPVIQTFEGHSDLIVSIYKPVAEQIINLFDRLQLPIKTWPLIKKQSGLRNKSQPSAAKYVRKEDSLTQLQDQRRKLKEKEQRHRTDPFLKTVQKNINDMFKSKDDSDHSINERKWNPGGERSEVKKKVVELKTIQQDKCSQLVDLYEQDLQPYQPSPNFTSQLYSYQAMALSWMMRREGHQHQTLKQKDQLHPLWTQFQLAGSKHRLFINELTSQISIKPPMSHSKCLGGILADQMGLGKTVMMAALISTANKAPSKVRMGKDGRNLVVVPLTLLSQWQAQLKKHTSNTKTLIYYAQQRKKHMNELNHYDVIITTYGTISHQFAKGFHVSKAGIYKFKWERIILDEAHYIKGRIIQTAKAVYQLEGLYRWCLTGTPIQNNLTDMFSLLHFIRYTPWSQYECWNKYINKPIQLGDENVYEVLRTILKRVFLRRTKQSKDQQGKPIVELPNKVSRIQLLQMSPKERQFYDKLYESSKLKIQQLQQKGILQTKYMQIFELLIRLRQICCHPILYKSISKFVTDSSKFADQLNKFIKKRGLVNQENAQKYYEPILEGEQEVRVQVFNGNAMSQCYIKETISRIERQEFQNCLVCLGQVQDPVITVCLHIFCKTCAIRQIEECGICSACRKRLTRQDFIYLPRQNRFNENLYDSSRYCRSTKILAVLQHLQKLKAEDKVVIFSQFLGMLDLIEHELKQEKIVYLRMQGSTSHKERTRIVQTFQKDATVQVFIVSLKTAGVGLNLVAANKVFLVDPWWNPGVQDQAIERVHRIGQKRQVQVTRFIMDQTIEMRMVELNTTKKLLSTKVLSQQGSLTTESRFEKLKYLMQKY